MERTDSFIYYRWNPYKQIWECWGISSNAWFISQVVPTDITYQFADWQKELYYKDTWAEPTLEYLG